MCVCVWVGFVVLTQQVGFGEIGCVRISKANMTFWAHLNCCYYSWRQMMSLLIRPRPLRKLPVVRRCPCPTAEKLLFSFFFSVCNLLCVYTLYSSVCVYVWNESPVLDKGVAPSLPEASSESLLHMAPPGPTASLALSLFLLLLCQAQRPSQMLCCPGAEKEREERGEGLETC